MGKGFPGQFMHGGEKRGFSSNDESSFLPFLEFSLKVCAINYGSQSEERSELNRREEHLLQTEQGIRAEVAG